MPLTDYVGAGARLDPERGLALDPDRWCWQPKRDGCYARVSLDRRGRVSTVLSRAGAPLREGADLIGILAGPPDSVLHGELEAHTEAGNRAAAARGWRALHLFDTTRLAGRDVSGLPFAARIAELELVRAQLGTDPARWRTDDHGDAHDVRTGRYTAAVPRDLRRLPLIAAARGAGSAAVLWRDVVERGGGEGLVAVRLDAPSGARNAKRKIKPTDTLDCTVLSCRGGAARLEYRGHTFVLSARGRWGQLAAGDLVEVAADGWYERSPTPRHPRIVRVRSDLAA